MVQVNHAFQLDQVVLQGLGNLALLFVLHLLVPRQGQGSQGHPENLADQQARGLHGHPVLQQHHPVLGYHHYQPDLLVQVPPQDHWNLEVLQVQGDLYLLLHQSVLLFLVYPLGQEGQAFLAPHVVQAFQQFLFAQWYQQDQGGHLDQVVHLPLGPLCLLGYQVGQLVLYHPLSHESQGPHEDRVVLPSQVLLWALQVLELQQGLEAQLFQQNQEIL